MLKFCSVPSSVSSPMISVSPRIFTITLYSFNLTQIMHQPSARPPRCRVAVVTTTFWARQSGFAPDRGDFGPAHCYIKCPMPLLFRRIGHTSPFVRQHLGSLLDSATQTLAQLAFAPPADTRPSRASCGAGSVSISCPFVSAYRQS